MFMNMYVHGYVYVYDSICWALKCPVHCAEPFLELKICISPQFRAIDPPNPARGFIQQNENVRFATAACMQKYGNVSFATVACAKCMRYGGRGGGPIPWGGGGVATRDTAPYIHMFWVASKYILLFYSEPSGHMVDSSLAAISSVFRLRLSCCARRASTCVISHHLLPTVLLSESSENMKIYATY